MADAFRWRDAYARLERAHRALEAGREGSPEEVARMLRERAQALARPPEEAEPAAEVLDLMVFTIAGERYGIGTDHILEVVPLRELTLVPCTPPVILGVLNYRGRILPVVDLRRLFELAGQGATDRSQVVAVEVDGMTFGITADAVAGTIRVGAHEVAPPPAMLAGDRHALIRGVTRDMVAVLDLKAMARDPRIAVNEEAV